MGRTAGGGGNGLLAVGSQAVSTSTTIAQSFRSIKDHLPTGVAKLAHRAQVVRQRVRPRTRAVLRQDLAIHLHVVGARPAAGGDDDFGRQPVLAAVVFIVPAGTCSPQPTSENTCAD